MFGFNNIFGNSVSNSQSELQPYNTSHNYQANIGPAHQFMQGQLSTAGAAQAQYNNQINAQMSAQAQMNQQAYYSYPNPTWRFETEFKRGIILTFEQEETLVLHKILNNTGIDLDNVQIQKLATDGKNIISFKTELDLAQFVFYNNEIKYYEIKS